MSAMSRTQRAMQLWSVLVLAARNQQVLSYSMVEKLTGLPKWTQADFLGVVAAYRIVNKLPPLTVLVVNEETGLPGGNFLVRRTFSADKRGFLFMTGSPTVSHRRKTSRRQANG